MRMMEVENLGRYLGLPSLFNNGKIKDFKFSIDKVWSVLQGWKHNFFSGGGKEVLIKSVVQAIPTYAMGCFWIPKGILSKISSMCARFWWGASGDKRKIYWKKWTDLCQPKELGGFNFKDLGCFNQALLAKQGWRILENPNLTISKVLQGRYFPQSSKLEASCSSTSSFFWKGLIWGLDLLKGGLRRNVGNGQNTRLFKDPWIPRPVTFQVLTSGDPVESDMLVADFITPTAQWDWLVLCVVRMSMRS